jgi:CheY-like chemotaxis protein
MSHEIRTPLNGILGFARFLSDETLNPSTRKQYLEVINRRGKALLQIVNDLINISLIDAGQVEIKAEPFNLNQLLFDLYTIFNSESNEKKKPNVVLKLNLSVNDSRSNIISDASRIEQILTNLIDNSLKFTHSGFVEFGYTIEKNDTIKFFVKDTGIGIPPNMREKVFCRFNRDENSTPYHTSGTGLGLPITKGLVSLLDGEIWFDSQIDLGTNFYFTIPYQKSESINDPYTSKSSISTQNLNFENKKILVVEDDLISYQFVEALLKGTNAKIIHAKNGEDAIEICRLVPDIDLVIMDMRLPFIDGYEATTQIKKQNPKLRVIAQTANVLSDDRSKCLKAGCDDYIPKPLDPDEFLRLIAHYIKKTEISRMH